MKLYADEAESDRVRSLAEIVVSVLARVEVVAALWGKQRSGAVPVEAVRTLVAEFEADWYGDGCRSPRFAVVVAEDAVLAEAARLAGVHGLRASDAVQLAAAMAARAADPACDTFACFDRSLAEAAARERFSALR